VFGNSAQDPWTQLLVVVKSKNEVGPIGASECSMRSGLTLDDPAGSQKSSEHAPWWRASYSRRLEGNVDELGWRFTVLEPFGDDTERESLYARHCFITIAAVA
jgi:hypothetical protein